MPKKIPTPEQMKADIEAFKKLFTPGFMHASPSNKIKEFDSTKVDPKLKDPDFTTPGVTFVAPMKSAKWAQKNFLNLDNEGMNYAEGATNYPLSVNLGKHFDPTTPEGAQIVKQFLQNKYPDIAKSHLDLKHEQWMDRLTDPFNNWNVLESPGFMNHLKTTGHDTFAVTEQGNKNIGVFKPENIRGKFAKFDPNEAMNPDFMKAEGGAIEGYADGRSVKKVLEFAKQIPFTHFSHQPELTMLEPAMYGKGIKGAEAARLVDAPDIRPRSYFYHGENIKPEQGLGPHKYTGISELSYPLHEDPEGFYKLAKQAAIDPYFAKMGVEIVEPGKRLNALERLIKESGYTGYHTGDAGIVFNRTPVVKATD